MILRLGLRASQGIRPLALPVSIKTKAGTKGALRGCGTLDERTKGDPCTVLAYLLLYTGEGRWHGRATAN